MTIYFTDMSALLAMNGYGAYVWPAWAVVLGLLVFQGVAVRAERTRTLAELRRRMRRERAQVSRDEPPRNPAGVDEKLAATQGEERLER